jgi:hypothetical protein
MRAPIYQVRRLCWRPVSEAFMKCGHENKLPQTEPDAKEAIALISEGICPHCHVRLQPERATVADGGEETVGMCPCCDYGWQVFPV